MTARVISELYYKWGYVNWSQFSYALWTINLRHRIVNFWPLTVTRNNNPESKVTRMEKMIDSLSGSWLLSKFSWSVPSGNVLRTVWRICIPTLRCKGVRRWCLVVVVFGQLTALAKLLRRHALVWSGKMSKIVQSRHALVWSGKMSKIFSELSIWWDRKDTYFKSSAIATYSDWS